MSKLRDLLNPGEVRDARDVVEAFVEHPTQADPQTIALFLIAGQLGRIADALEGRIEVRTQTERGLEDEVDRAAEAHERRMAARKAQQ